MIIREATASFGKLENNGLELQDGLNIIYSPNESGKSTWCSFIKAMLFGIDSSARRKAGVLPDKTKYKPWNGTPMSGTLKVATGDKDIILTRKGQGKYPMSDFSATYAGTSDEITSLTNSNVGEILTGVSKDVFERTAFIGQANLKTSNSVEIEKRVADVVQTGSEEVSYIESRERLKSAIRKRKYNKSGRIPKIDKEIEEIKIQLSSGTNELKTGDELRRARQNAVRQRDEIQNKVSELRKSARRQSLDKMSEVRSDINTHESYYLKAKDNVVRAEEAFTSDIFGKATPEKCVNQFKEDKSIISNQKSIANSGLSVPVIFAIMLTFIAIGVVFAVTHHYLVSGIFVAISLIPMILGIIKIKKRQSTTYVIQRILRKYHCQNVSEAEELLRIHCENYKNYIQSVKDLKIAEVQLKEVKQKAEVQNTCLLKELDFIENNTEASKYTHLLEEAENELRTAREQFAQWKGRQSVSANTEELDKRLSLLKKEREILTCEYEALMLALETLDEARDDIRHRVTPQLSQKTSDYFSLLTGKRYDAVALDKEFQATARLTGDNITREQSYLSIGTADQLYFATRLSMCDLLLPQENPCPIILDDALVNFDDERCKKAIDLLYQISKSRQVILFTCHNREIMFSKNYPNANIIINRN